MKIQTSIDWYDISSEIKSQMNNIGYNRDIYKIYQNISNMVEELSKLEINKQAKRKEHLIDEHLSKINNAIDVLEKYLLMALLMK